MESSAAPLEPLTPPDPVGVVEPGQADQMVQLDTAKVPELDARIATFIDNVIVVNVQHRDFQLKVNAIHNLGSKEIRAAASASNRMLDRPAQAMDAGLLSPDSPVASSLVDLRRTIEDLDPSQHALAPRKLLGLIPWGNKLHDYFRRYQSSQTHINALLERLQRGQDELRKDNAAIEQEKVNLWNVMEKLQQYVYIGKRIDEALETHLANIERDDQEKARVVREEMLFYVRQKVTDLLTQLAVSVQGYLALDMLRKNNLELIKGIERAMTTTISALRTAVIVAQALTNQKLVLDQISALNRTTSDLISSTSILLKRQSGEVHQQASSSTIELNDLREAFANIYVTMDMIAAYKNQALDNMQQTVRVLSTEINVAQGYLNQSRATERSAATGDLQRDDGTQEDELQL